MKYLVLIFASLLSLNVFAQTACDSLDFVSIQYSPFTDSLIVVTVTNNSSELFDYPGFVLINSDGDTLAKENVNYFGIGGQSVHMLNVRPGIADPLDQFNGVMQLFTGFFEEFACEWNLDQSLCASETCDSMIIGFQNWGGALVLGDFVWSVMDSTGSVVESGTLTMTEQEQYWFYGMCLTPGMYSYNLAALGEPSGGGPTLTVSSSTWYASPTISQYLDWNAGTTLEVPFFLHCIDTDDPNGISAPNGASLTIRQEGNTIRIENAVDTRSISLLNTQGQLIASYGPNTTVLQIPSGIASGLSLIVIETPTGRFRQKIVLR